MQLDKEGVEKMKKLGREGIEKKFRVHLRELWEKTGQLKKKESRLGNWCCILFMVLFFAFMVLSKMNEETLSLLGMNTSEKKEVTSHDQDYYELLQISPDASAVEIKKQYRKLADQYHPDRTTNEEHKKLFLKLTEAYEVLRDENKKEMYDQTYGMGNFKNYIRSKTMTLTSQNFDRLVTNSPHTWVIQVFDHDSYLSQTFSDTWEKMAEKYYFLKFGRIDRRTQQRLIHKLPFRPLEYPFLYVHPHEGAPDFVEYHPGDDLGKKLIQTIKDTIPTKIKIIGSKMLGDWLEDLPGVTEPQLVFLNRAGFEDILFLHESPILERINFLSTRNDLYGIIQAYLNRQYPGKPVPRYIFIHPHGSPAAEKFGQVEFIQGGYHTFSNRLHLLYPPPVTRLSASHLCSGGRLCLLSLEKLADLAASSAAKECVLGEAVQGCDRYRTLIIDQPSPAEIKVFFAQLTAGNSHDSVLAYDSESDRVAIVGGAKSAIQNDGFEGLGELCQEEVNLEGRYISDTYLHSTRLDDLLSSGSLVSEVFSGKSLAGFVQALVLSLAAVFGITRVVDALRPYQKSAMVACVVISVGRILQQAAHDSQISTLKRNK